MNAQRACGHTFALASTLVPLENQLWLDVGCLRWGRCRAFKRLCDPAAHMSQKEIPFDSHALLAQSVRKLLSDAGPLTPKELVRQLRRNGSPLLQASAVRKILDQTIANEVERLPGNLYRLAESSS